MANTDVGVTVVADGVLRAVMAAGSGPVEFANSRLADVETMHAMTIHKSQGSQADGVTVLLPSEDSRLLTRELFYTAVTRARTKVPVASLSPVIFLQMETLQYQNLFPSGWRPFLFAAVATDWGRGRFAQQLR